MKQAGIVVTSNRVAGTARRDAGAPGRMQNR